MNLAWVENHWQARVRSPRFRAALGLVCLLTMGGVVAYQLWPSRQPQPNTVTAAPAVTAVSALGRLEPEGEVIQVFAPLSSAAGARIESLRVSQGQWVRKGDTIAVLDVYEQRQAALQAAKEQVQVTEAQLRQVKAGAKVGQIQAQAADVDRKQVELQTETAAQEATVARLIAELRNAELESQRYQALYAEGAVSASLKDSKQLAADTGRQQLNEAQTNLSRIQLSGQQQVAAAQSTLDQIAEVRPVDVEVAQSQVAQAQANVATARADLDLAVVRSPQDGQVLKIQTRPGELVGTQGIISLGQTRRMVAVAEVYESDISRIRIGQAATAISKNNAFPTVLRGKVMEVGLEVGKQDVLNTDPAAQFDARVVEVKVLLDESSSREVAGLTNLSLEVEIDPESI